MALEQRSQVAVRRLLADDFQPPSEFVQQAPFVTPHGTEVHLWRIRLDLPGPTLAGLAAVLSSDEQERADRFIRQQDCDRFVACRGALRSILGRYAGLPARSCRFEYGSYGKPRLWQSPAAAAVQFNVSHSGNRALIAVARDRAVGVDLEQIRPDVDIHGVGRLVFSAAERETLQTLPEQDQLAAFFNLWTCKEAYLKAMGRGFSGAPQQVTLTAGLTLLESVLGDGEDGASVRWSVASLSLVQGYAAAVAVEGPCSDCCYADWSPDHAAALPQSGC
jgi:4'-phosphopantetheinyl transferase